MKPMILNRSNAEQTLNLHVANCMQVLFGHLATSGVLSSSGDNSEVSDERNGAAAGLSVSRVIGSGQRLEGLIALQIKVR